jgi:hypothetical protein
MAVPNLTQWLGPGLESGGSSSDRGTSILPMALLKFIKPMVARHRPWFKLFWRRADAAFANPETCEYCEEYRITYSVVYP